MLSPQTTMFLILGITMAMFIWGRFRYDIVAFSALLFAAVLGLVPAGSTFSGFGHPAVITVAAVLVISRALQNSGVIDLMTSRLGVLTHSPLLHIGALSAAAALLSGFMNNVGALALLMPVALQTAASTGRSPAMLLMPLSFGSILGGLMTLMGTPPNIIIASYRQELTGQSFAVFDFAPIGVVLTVAGVAFITFIGWRLIPKERRGKRSAEDLFEISDYIVEARVLEGSALVGKGLRQLERLADDDITGVGVLRGDSHIISGARYARLRVDDVVIFESDPKVLRDVVEAAGVELLGSDEFHTDDLRSEDVGLVEAVVMPNSRLINRTFAGLRLARKYSMNLIAVARRGKPFKRRLHRVQLREGDVMLLQGPEESLTETITELGCLPLAKRGLRIGKRPAPFIPLAWFGAALVATVSGWLSVHIAFCLAVVGLVATRTVTLRDVYSTIDWPVVVLLAAMIPLGRALETTGGTALIASSIVDITGDFGPVIVMSVLLVVTMTLSDVMNNAATAVVMAPIAATLANQLGVDVDPFLMAVAIGASCAFLTPIGHQNNVLVMGPGGYHFGDYWRMGLPLQLLVVVIAVPLITFVWPLT